MVTTYSSTLELGPNARDQNQPLDAGFLNRLLDVLRYQMSMLDDVLLVKVQRGSDVQDGVRASKVDGCSILHVALDSLKTGVRLKLLWHTRQVAVNTLNLERRIGGVRKQGPDCGSTRFWGGWGDCDIHLGR
jgi:hypothetical protein